MGGFVPASKSLFCVQVVERQHFIHYHAVHRADSLSAATRFLLNLHFAAHQGEFVHYVFHELAEVEPVVTLHQAEVHIFTEPLQPVEHPQA